MSRNTKIVMAAAAALLAAVAVFAWLNRGSVAEKKATQDSGTFLVTYGDIQYTVSMEDIEALDPRTIDANYKKSGKNPEPRQYTGVPLVSVFDFLGIDCSAASSVSFTAADGYASALPIADALDEESCYIIIAEGGAPLGTKESGGSGPFMMILALDQFSQRWCKFLMEVAVK